MSTIIDVADAVLFSLNAGSFEPPVDAVRKYVPSNELSALGTLAVTVVPKALNITAATRDSSYFDCTIDIGIQKRVDVDNLATVDALEDLVAQIIDHLRMSPLSAMESAVWTSIANEPIFATVNIDQHRVFTSVISVTYRVRR